VPLSQTRRSSARKGLLTLPQPGRTSMNKKIAVTAQRRNVDVPTRNQRRDLHPFARTLLNTWFRRINLPVFDLVIITQQRSSRRMVIRSGESDRPATSEFERIVLQRFINRG